MVVVAQGNEAKGLQAAILGVTGDGKHLCHAGDGS
jgi:hypothetical protein